MNTNKINQSTISEIFGEPTYIYTREQAIEDGVLFDVSSVAKNEGFTIPVAVTLSVWSKIECTEGSEKQMLQGTENRLKYVLFMLRLSVTPLTTDTIFYKVHYSNDRRKNRSNPMTLKATIGGGDDGEPVVTIMMSDED